MGAKLVSSMHLNKKISLNQAKSMLSFCSVSGPMFIIGTVGVSIFNSYKVGLVILISNILACLINGLFYKNKDTFLNEKIEYNSNNLCLADIIYDSLISILMVGAYIAISFVFVDIIKCFNIFNSLGKIFNLDLSFIEAVFTGIIEITRGSIEICNANANIILKTILTSGVIAFGGISVFLQSLGFLKSLNIKPKVLLLQKFTQCIICLIVSVPISFIFLYY